MTLRSSIPFLCSFSLALCLLLLGLVSTDTAQQPTTKAVHYADIPRKVQIIGKLGLPLGQLVTVRGEWTEPDPSKPAEPFFAVIEVNGRPLKNAAEFATLESVLGEGGPYTQKVVGQEWELRGVESGGFEGFREEVWAECGRPVEQRPPSGFLTRFYCVKAKRISLQPRPKP